MARRSTVRGVAEFILFDVLYEDGTRTSNRKIPGGRSARLTAALKGSQGKRAKVVRDLVEKVIIAEDKDQNQDALTARSQGVRVDPLVSVRRSCPTTWRAASRSKMDQISGELGIVKERAGGRGKAAPFDRSPYVSHIQTDAASTSQIAPKSASDNNTTAISGAVRLILIGR